MTKDELLKIHRERRRQVLNIGDHVIAHSASDKPLYDGKVATIIEKGISGNDVYYGLYIEGVTIEKRSKITIGWGSELIGNTSLLAPFFAEDLELVDEPQPKFKRGDKVVVTSDNGNFVPYVGKIARLDKDSAQITVGCGLINVPIDRLMPYTEPTTEDSEEKEPKLSAEVDMVSEGTANRLAEQLAKIRPIQDVISAPAWQSYRMELAKAVAIAYAEKGRYEPSEIGAKAVEVANGVVDELKKKQQ